MSLLTDFPTPSLTVDLVVMTVIDGGLAVLVHQRDTQPFAGDWALPGGFVHEGETLDQTAQRILDDKACLQHGWLEQLYTFSDPKRDPRGWVVTVAYFALLEATRLQDLVAKTDTLTLLPFALRDGAVTTTTNAELKLAFDHADIVQTALTRIRGKIAYTPIAFGLLGQRFTLRDLQAVHEAVLGEPLNKPAFRRRMLDTGWLKATGERETVSTFRPAELYEFNTDQGEV